jgi:hypothetical protein
METKLFIINRIRVKEAKGEHRHIHCIRLYQLPNTPILRMERNLLALRKA